MNKRMKKIAPLTYSKKQFSAYLKKLMSRTFSKLSNVFPLF